MSDLKKIKKTVMVDICQTQSLNGYDPMEIEEEALGSLYQVDRDTYILAFDTLLSDKKVTTTVKIANNTLSIVKIGDVLYLGKIAVRPDLQGRGIGVDQIESECGERDRQNRDRRQQVGVFAKFGQISRR